MADDSKPTPAELAEMKRVKAEADRDKQEKAAPTTKSGMGDKLFAKGGSIRGGNISAKYMSFSKTGKPAGMKPVTKMARGGGIESRGKTKGRMV